MSRVLLPLLALALLAAACGGDDGDGPTQTPAATVRADSYDNVYARYISLAEARDVVAGLGVAGETFTDANYLCLDQACRDNPPGDASMGCLVVIPTGDPATEEVLSAKRPAEWYSTSWYGVSRESFSAAPEPVTLDPTADFQPGMDLTCGSEGGTEFQSTMTGREAADLLSTAGLETRGFESGEFASCPPGGECPATGIPPDETGCLSVQTEWPPPLSGPYDGRLYVNWFGPTSISWDPQSVRLEDIEAHFPPGRDEDCVAALGGKYEPYIPNIEVIVPAEWRLWSPTDGATLDLIVAVGNSCDSFERIDVTETDDTVLIEALSREDHPGPGGGCDDLLITERHTVELDRPLGGRTLEGCDPLPKAHYFDDIGCSEAYSER